MACIAALAACLSVGLLHAAPKKRPQTHEGTHAHDKHHAHEDGAEDVKDVLLREQVKPLDRRAELHPILNRRPDFAPARWHSGYVDVAGSWRSFTSPPDPKALELLEEYRHRCIVLDKTAHSQMQMAHWCRQQGLRDQERAHLMAALDDATAADRSAIYERLGYHPFGSQWLSPGEIAEWTAVGKQAEASLKHWGPMLEGVASHLDGSPHQRRAAQKILNGIQDPAAIPAIESALLYGSEIGALAAVETLGHIDAYQSSQALARAAMFSNVEAVRSAATATLKPRRMDDYVPSLIDLLSTDVEPRFQRVGVDRGTVFFTYMLVREKADEVDVRSRTVMHPAAEVLRIHYYIMARQLVVTRKPVPAPSVEAVRDDVDRAYQQDRQLRQQNEAIEQLNNRTISVLSAVSGEPASHKPQDWWNWWDQVSDRQLIRGKTVVRVDEFAASGIALPTWSFSKGSCFVAGTPVWTETGPVAIEKLQIGDRVLAQNVETGELAYKPVLQATVRLPRNSSA
jgi:hypothetical protein